MARYIELPTSRKDAEEHSDDDPALPYAASDSYRQAGPQEQSTSNRLVVALVGAGLLLLVVLSTGYHWANWVRNPRTFFGPPPPFKGSTAVEFHLGRGNVPGPAELLTSAAPAKSYQKALRPELRYLTADSFNGWTGHVFAAFSLLYLAQLTQRVAILPSFGDEFHYGESMITLGHLYDMERFRRERGALFVDWVDVKPLDPDHNFTETDDIGCYMGNNEFEAGTSFGKFNLERSIWRVDRSTPFPNSVESFVLWDYDEKRRLSETKTFAQTRGYTLPSNMLESSSSSNLLCYGNIWALAHASARVRGWSYFSDYVPEVQHDSGGLLKMMDPSVRGMWPEWYSIGQYIDFTPKVWNIAIDCVKRTLRTNRIPKHLITVHLRRGDFKQWCPTHQQCVPTIDRYSEQVQKFSSDSPGDTRVLVTTDEQDDAEFLASVDNLGWFRIDHRQLGTADVLRAEYGETWRWADAAVDQAILSLGMAFVGTADSQVSVISELRVATWNGGRTHLVKRPI